MYSFTEKALNILVIIHNAMKHNKYNPPENSGGFLVSSAISLQNALNNDEPLQASYP